MADKMQTRQYTEFQFVAGTTGKTLTVHDADVAQWLEDIIDERDELVQMGALDGRKLTEEINALRHDIARHVQIAAEQAQEMEKLRQDLAAARAEIERLRAGGCTRDQRSTQWCAEAEALRHDIARHVEIAADQAQEAEDLRADLAAAQARVAELETELRRALAIAPSNAIAWQERAIGAELERDQYRHERDAYRDAMARMNAPAIALAATQPPPPIIMPAQDWELHQQIQTLNERLAYVEPIVTAARNLVDNAEEYECDGLGLFAQHGWWEPLHDALDPDGKEPIDDVCKRVTAAK